jgi:hypothetical protein
MRWSELDLDAVETVVEAGKKITKPAPVWRLPAKRTKNGKALATGLQRLGVRLEVTEAVLNHVSGSRAGVIGVYQRHAWVAEKRMALDAWAQHVLVLTTGDNVVTLRA